MMMITISMRIIMILRMKLLIISLKMIILMIEVGGKMMILMMEAMKK